MPTSTLPAAITVTYGRPTVFDVFGTVLAIIDQIIVPLLFALALIMFLWGVYQYFIVGGADEEKRRLGRDFVVYSLIGFFLMVSVWGLVNILVATLGFGGQNRPALPCFTGSCSSSGSLFGDININI